MLRHHSLLSCSYVTLALLAVSAIPSAAMDDLALDTGAEMISLDSLPEALPDLAEEIAAPTETAAEQPPAPEVLPAPEPAPQEATAPLTQPAPTAQTAPAQPAATKQPHRLISSGNLLDKVRKGKSFTTEEMEAWIAQTPDLNMCFDNGRTMLLYVVSYSPNLEALRLLMEYGADVQTHCFPRYEALFIAAINNPSADVIELLINNGANLVEKDHEDNTALMLAATFNKNSKVIDKLLEYGLRVNARNKFGFDSLMLAAYENGTLPVLQSLLDNEAEVNGTDNEGHTALMAAAVRGNDDVMQYLIRRGANFKAVDKNGLSVLDYYNKRRYLETLGFKINQFSTPSERLKAEFDFIAKNHHNFNVALKEGIYAENPDAAVADAIANLADIDVLNENGCTTFLNAALNNNSLSVLEKLINAKADVSADCLDGKTALMFISAQADETHIPSLQIEKAKLLLSSGAEVNQTDDVGNTALMYALANRADINYILTLLEAGADINVANNLGETPFWTAVRQNLPVETVKLLIEYGADVNWKDRRNETPLWYLLRTGGDEVIIRTLLRGGANTDIPNAAGDIPLWYVLNKGGSDMIIENIILAQKDLNIKNEHGDTPLLYALKNNFPPKFVQLLLSRGADPQIRDSEGNNAYDILRNSQFFDAAVQKRTRERVLNDWE